MAIVLKTISDSKEAQADLAKLRGSVNSIQQSVDKVSESFSNFTKILGVGIAGFAAIQTFSKYSDSLTNLETKLRIATDSQEEFGFALNSVRKIANSTSGDLNSVASLYSRLSRAGKDFGAAQGDIARATDLISKAIATSGSGAQEANAAIVQLGQALASGRLAGDELRSVLENAPPLAQAIAKGLGVSIGKLRELGEAGSLSSVKVFQAILKQQAEIEKNFSKVQVTYGQAFQNLGNSLVVLFDEIKKAAVGSTGGFAESINNLANRIFKFAINFRISLQIAKTDLALFITKAILYFVDLWDSLDETSKRIKAIAAEIYQEWQPVLLKVSDQILQWSKAAIVSAIAVSAALVEAFKNTDFGSALIDNSKKFIENVRQFLLNAFNTIANNIPKIDIRKFLPGLDTAISYIKSWAEQAERWFFWLYDRVVGRSWIPDLVTKVIDWLGKLNQKPVGLIAKFAEKANLSFAGIKVTGPFVSGLAAIYKYKSELSKLLVVLTAVGGIFAGLNLFKGGQISIDPNEGPQSKSESILEKSLDWLKKIQLSVKESFDKSVTGRTIKQLLGMPDRTPGTIFGETIDTSSEAKVGRGPYRKYDAEIRGFGHDFINAFPRDWQVPLIAGFTGIFALAIFKAFDAGTTRTVILSVLTSAAAIFAARTVDPKLLNQSLGKAAFTFLEILEKGISTIFSGNVLKDPVGVLSLIAKSALLFEKGREALGKAALNIGTAPTRLAQASVSVLERSLLNRDVAKTNKELAQLPGKLNTTFQQNQREARSTLNALSNLRDSTGNLIGATRARAAVQAGDTQAFGTRASALAVAQAAQAQRDLQRAQLNLRNLPAIQSNLRASAAESQRQSEAITKALQEQKDAFKQGFKNLGAGAGGILGGLAGFQIGTEIAKGMTGSPEWVKVGTAMAISFIGQGIGAAIGNVIAATLLAAASGIGGLIVSGMLLLNPFVRGAVLISAALIAGYQLFQSLPDDWKKGISEFFSAEPGSKGAGYKAATTVFERAAVEKALQEQTPEQRKEILESNERLITVVGKLSTTLEEWLRKNAPTTSNPVIKKASGGWIRGPGTATSDSIPAMLSNGEFVVSAENARKNWDLLTAINSGRNVKRFQAGTQSSATNLRAIDNQTLVASESKLDKFLKLFSASFDTLSEKLKNSPLFKVDVPKVETGGPAGTKPSGQLAQVLESSKNIYAGIDAVAIRLESLDFKDVRSGLSALARETPDEFRRIADLLDKSAELMSSQVGQNQKLGEFVRNQNRILAQQNFAEVARILGERRIGTVPSKFVTPPETPKPTEVLFGEQLTYINKAFPELNLTVKDLLRISDDVRENIFRNAIAIAKSTAELDRIKLGTLEGGLAPSPADALKKRRGIEAQRVDFAAQARKAIKGFRTPFEDFRITLEEVGQNITEDTFNLLDQANKWALDILIDELRAAQEITKEPGTPPEAAREAQQQISGYLEKIKRIIDSATEFALKDFEKFRKDLAGTGIDFDKRTFNLLLDKERKQIREYSTKIQAAERELETATEARRIELQEYIDNLLEDINKILVSKGKDFKTPAQQAGQAFASSITDGFTNAFKGLLKGEMSDDKGIWVTFRDRILQNISGTVIDTFTAGIAERLIGKGGFIQKGLESLGEGLFNFGGKTIDYAKSFFPTSATEGEEPSIGLLGNIFKGITDGFNSGNNLLTSLGGAVSGGFSAALPVFGSLLSSFLGLFGLQSTEIVTTTAFYGIVQAFLTSINAGIWSLVTTSSLNSGFSWLGFASGGLVSGKGTATSDSIPAMLSDGEFIINARAAKDNLALLSAINSGEIKRFAEGGLVSTSMLNTPTTAIPFSNSNSMTNQQTININITGDISRQTKSEVYRMLPMISEGVNAHNREKGYRG